MGEWKCFYCPSFKSQCISNLLSFCNYNSDSIQHYNKVDKVLANMNHAGWGEFKPLGAEPLNLMTYRACTIRTGVEQAVLHKQCINWSELSVTLSEQHTSRTIMQTVLVTKLTKRLLIIFTTRLLFMFNILKV